jgi:Lar family restriction alleviation protein
MKLRNCPFCGCSDIEVLETKSGILGLNGEYFVWCLSCTAQSGNFDKKQDARFAWNRRYVKPKGKL